MIIEHISNTALSRAQVDAMEKQARAIAVELGVPVDDIADTVQFVAKRGAGWDPGVFRIWCYVVRPEKVRIIKRLNASSK